jgi:hypothetical protein
MNIELLTGIIALITAIGAPCVGFGLLQGRVEALEKDTVRHSASIGKLFDSQREIAELKGKVDSINETLNRLAVKIDAFIMQERK